MRRDGVASTVGVSTPAPALKELPSFPTPVVHSLSHVQLFATPWTVAHQASLSFIISHEEFAQSCPLS